LQNPPIHPIKSSNKNKKYLIASKKHINRAKVPSLISVYLEKGRSEGKELYSIATRAYRVSFPSSLTSLQKTDKGLHTH
jgi:hypothetical protein